MTYVTKIITDEETGLPVLIIPEELLKSLDLKENELLEWTIEDEKTVIINRSKIIHTQGKE